jgi:hypothetical protein
VPAFRILARMFKTLTPFPVSLVVKFPLTVLRKSALRGLTTASTPVKDFGLTLGRASSSAS